ncbi:MAG TPA: class I SAM-dependent methyltransferase [Balneolaceae bacterium]|nr:class I SAM-dependent methyltransferase [Balneolaceae bacterium]
MNSDHCILCNAQDVDFFFKNRSGPDQTTYYTCNQCHLIFASDKDRPSPREEFARYNQHENNPDDPQYRAFLTQLFRPMQERLSAGSKGLDFGSGPGPTLHRMFEDHGHDMQIFDPFYANNPAVFEESYDFITATEVAEHLHHPAKEFKRLWSCLLSGGYLGIMTKRAEKERSFFANWYYHRDPTHVTFYTKETFLWLADEWDASITFPGENIAIFKK